MPDALHGLDVTEPLPATLPLRERLVVGVSNDGECTIVACDDGAVFTTRWPDKTVWLELPPIPGTPRWYQVTGEAMDRG